MTKKFSIEKGFLVLIILLNVILGFDIYFGHSFLVKYVDRIKNLSPSMNYFLFLIATWYLLSSWIPLMSKKELWDISVLINYNKGQIRKKEICDICHIRGRGGAVQRWQNVTLKKRIQEMEKFRQFWPKNFGFFIQRLYYIICTK